MNKYVMALTMLIFGSLIITLFNWLITKEFHWGLGLLPAIVALIVAAVTKVQSQVPT